MNSPATLTRENSISTQDLKTLALQAYIYTVPLVIVETFRRKRTERKPMNTFLHARKLLNHRSRLITAPNNDTLYSDAWIDLAQGPVTVTVPATGERYFSLALMDMFSNNFAVLGTRTVGGDGGKFIIVGPDDSAEGLDGNIVRAPTPRVWALARILVDGPEDLDAARAVQDDLAIEAPLMAEIAEPEMVTRSASWSDYLQEADRLLRANKPPATDLGILRRISALGLGTEQGFDPKRYRAEEAAQIEAGVEEARRQLVEARGSQGEFFRGWVYPQANLGNFGQDYFCRAGVAIWGLGALPLEEATYLRPEGENGDGLYDGRRTWQLHLPADNKIPVGSFWSLTLYEPTDDGEFYFTDNPLQRYAIGDRTEGLKINGDGSLDIWIGHANPGKERESNWLPAPDGPFSVLLRAYLPYEELIRGRYAMPLLVPADL